MPPEPDTARHILRASGFAGLPHRRRGGPSERVMGSVAQTDSFSDGGTARKDSPRDAPSLSHRPARPWPGGAFETEDRHRAVRPFRGDRVPSSAKDPAIGTRLIRARSETAQPLGPRLPDRSDTRRTRLPAPDHRGRVHAGVFGRRDGPDAHGGRRVDDTVRPHGARAIALGAREPRGAYGRALPTSRMPTSRTGVGSRFELTFGVDQSVGTGHPPRLIAA